MLAGFSLASSRFRISFFYFFFIFNLWWLWPCVDTSISHEPWCMVRKSIEWTLRWESCLQVRRCALKSTIVVVGVAHPTLSQHVSTGHVPPNPILSILGIQSSCIGGSIAHLMGLFFFCKRTHSRLIMNHGGNIPCIRERRAFNAVHLLQGMIRTRDPGHPMDIP